MLKRGDVVDGFALSDRLIGAPFDDYWLEKWRWYWKEVVWVMEFEGVRPHSSYRPY